MSNDTIISVEGVSKKFCRSLKRTMLYGARDVARDIFGLSQNSDGLRQDEFWALDNVSFEVKRGECLGLIGPNGAGKSTLLKLLNGIILPDKGKIKVTGRIGALLELGAGFHPMLTGRENIRLTGAILGLSEKDIAQTFDAIVDFADLKEFIDIPVKYYSSGMYVRLGYAIAAHLDRDVLLIDEVLAVGDVGFRAKCVRHIQNFLARGGSVILVSHDLGAVGSLCEPTLLMKGGRTWRLGLTEEVLNVYYTYGDGSSTSGHDAMSASQAGQDSYSEKKAPVAIVDVTVLNVAGRKQSVFRTGERMTICVEFTATEPVENPVFGIAIYNTHGARCHAITTLADDWRIGPVSGRAHLSLHYQDLNLLAGRYSVAVSVSDATGLNCWQYIGFGCDFFVDQHHRRDTGQIFLPHEWSIDDLDDSPEIS
jgi:lipopolysaccharide transport system ATP-binding protein